jgi:hypothetical protein
MQVTVTFTSLPAEQWLTVIVMNRWLLIYDNLVTWFHLEISLENPPRGEFESFSIAKSLLASVCRIVT